MTTTLIHFGLAKTATTYLQKTVFPGSKGVNYLGKPFRGRGRALLHGLSRLAWHPPLDRFLADEAALRDPPPDRRDFTALEAQLRAALSASRLNIWSHEGLLRPTRNWTPLDRPAALDTIRTVFGAAGSRETHALVVLRDTRTLMKSYARHFFHEVAFMDLNQCSPGDLYRLAEGGEADRLDALFWKLWYAYFDFGALVSDLQRSFGADHVHVLNYDRLAQDWGGLQSVVSRIHPAARLRFPEVRVNATADKTRAIPPDVQKHLRMLDALDLVRLYPENDARLREAGAQARA